MRFLKFIKKLGPGLLFAGAAIGVSHLVQSTKAGANFGFGLLWALLLINAVKYPFFQFGARYANATGESLLDGYHKLGKPFLVIYYLLTFATMFTIQTAVTLVTASLATDLFGIELSLFTWSLLITLLCLALVTLGRYTVLDALIKGIIITLSLSTLFAVALAISNLNTPVPLQQILPHETSDLIFLIAFMGWMPAPLDVSIWHSLWVVEKNKTHQNTIKKQGLLDFNVGYITTVLLGIGFVSLGALVLYNSGVPFETSGTAFSKQLITLYTKSLGDEFLYIISIAAFTTMFSTTLTTLDASPRAMAKTTELLFNNSQSKKLRLIWSIVLAVGTVIILQFFSKEMRILITIATILSFLTAPFYAYINLALITSKHTPLVSRPKIGLRIFSWIGIFTLVAFNIWYLITLL